MRPRQCVLQQAVIALLFVVPNGVATVRGRRLEKDESVDNASNETLGYSGHAADAAVWGEVTFIRDASLAAFQSLQPRVTVVEGLRSRNGIASISNPGTLDAECTTMPMSVSTRAKHAVHMMRCQTNLTRRVLTCRVTVLAGTSWCQGAPTYWVTGHQIDNERPRCLWDGAWVVSNTTELNYMKDRHACVNMDVNRIGYEDIICNVGAKMGKG